MQNITALSRITAGNEVKSAGNSPNVAESVACKLLFKMLNSYSGVGLFSNPGYCLLFSVSRSMVIWTHVSLSRPGIKINISRKQKGEQQISRKCSQEFWGFV